MGGCGWRGHNFGRERHVLASGRPRHDDDVCDRIIPTSDAEQAARARTMGGAHSCFWGDPFLRNSKLHRNREDFSMALRRTESFTFFSVSHRPGQRRRAYSRGHETAATYLITFSVPLLPSGGATSPTPHRPCRGCCFSVMYPLWMSEFRSRPPSPLLNPKPYTLNLKL